jgi:hypothetical protein
LSSRQSSGFSEWPHIGPPWDALRQLLPTCCFCFYGAAPVCEYLHRSTICSFVSAAWDDAIARRAGDAEPSTFAVTCATDDWGGIATNRLSAMETFIRVIDAGSFFGPGRNNCASARRGPS